MSARGGVALITGGAGFIGTNLADRLLSSGQDVLLFDDLSRRGVTRNVQWLQQKHGQRVRLHKADVRDSKAVTDAVAGADEIYHLAAQTAVTTSLSDPRRDFEINCRGTLNVLEAARQRRDPPPILFTSTNKVYGALEDVELSVQGKRYDPVHQAVREHGISERRNLDFHSPYGCSKGAADQYVLDYARCFGMQNVVFRMSCIYGPHQQGNEDQGWVAHFMMSVRDGTPITIFGDGLQVRDILFIDDLLDAFQRAMEGSAKLAGRAFNIGGGARNTLSLLELMDYLEKRTSSPPKLRHAAARDGDQRYYVSDTRAFSQATGWRAQVTADAGLARLHDFMLDSLDMPSLPVAAAGGQ
jgi:CDP-paratose 2-epimerase